MNRKISIIVPVYKVEPYIRKCVESILAQTYTNFELILVNDGSPDKSGDICNEYAQKDERVKVIHKRNEGVSSARNAGLDIATGELIGFVDGDDFIEIDMYDTLYRQLDQNHADVVECGVKVLKWSTLEPIEQNNICDGKIECGDKLFALKKSMENPLTNVVWNKLYKKALFDDLRFPDKLYEDGFVLYKIFYKLKKYVFVGVNKYNYIKRENSIMEKQKNYTLKNLDGLEVQEERYQFLKSKINNPTILILAEYHLFHQILFHYQKMKKMENEIDIDKKYRKILKNKFQRNYSEFLSNYRLSKYKCLVIFSKSNFLLFDFLFSHYDYYLNYLELIGIIRHQIKKLSKTRRSSTRKFH